MGTELGHDLAGGGGGDLIPPPPTTMTTQPIPLAYARPVPKRCGPAAAAVAAFMIALFMLGFAALGIVNCLTSLSALNRGESGAELWVGCVLGFAFALAGVAAGVSQVRWGIAALRGHLPGE